MWIVFTLKNKLVLAYRWLRIYALTLATLTVLGCTDKGGSNNGLPTAPVVSLSPDPAVTTDDLNVSIDTASTDPEGDTITYGYAWTKNGTASTASTSATLPQSATAKGETWEVTVTPNDGHGDGDSASASVTIGNIAPTAPVISIDPAAPAAGTDDLLCQVGTASTDADSGDTVTYSMTWTVDTVTYAGAPVTTYNTDDTIAGTATSDADVWECTATPNDGDDVGATSTASVTIITPCLDLDCAVKLTGEVAYDYVGWSVSTAAGDVNNDGYDDVLVGAYGDDTGGTEAGAVYLLFGGTSW